MPGPLRSNAFVRGLPNLPEKDQEKLRVSNMLADFAGSLIRAARKLNIPGGEENPATSFLWLFPSRAKQSERDRVSNYIVDYCACGTPWRARTRLQLWGAPLCQPLLRLKCRGRGICSFSGKPHLVLSGASGGSFLTNKKNNYPVPLCKILAKYLSTTANNILSSNMWQHYRT